MYIFFKQIVIFLEESQRFLFNLKTASHSFRIIRLVYRKLYPGQETWVAFSESRAHLVCRENRCSIAQKKPSSHLPTRGHQFKSLKITYKAKVNYLGYSTSPPDNSHSSLPTNLPVYLVATVFTDGGVWGGNKSHARISDSEADAA